MTGEPQIVVPPTVLRIVQNQLFGNSDLLTSWQKKAAVLRIGHGMPAKAIGRQMNQPAENVEVLANDAVLLLREASHAENVLVVHKAMQLLAREAELMAEGGFCDCPPPEQTQAG